jgi:flagellar motility protein MotE (MotC chaperone)
MAIRLIPATIATAGLLLGVKLIDVSVSIPQVEAQQTGTEAPAAKAELPKPEEAKPAEATAEKKPEEAVKPEEAKPAEAAAEAKKEEEPKKEEAKKEEATDKPNPNVSEKPGETTSQAFSAVELELLQNLSRRREELDRWERNIQIKESALDATEKRINDKIVQIDAMKKEVSELLAQYNKQEDAKIRSLVKIYEAMKPKDAARIFDEMEMPILLLVIDKMAEKKSAPILAGMDSRKAKQITVELAQQHKVNTANLNTLTSQSAATPPANPTAQ